MQALSDQHINKLQRLAGAKNLKAGNLHETIDEGINQGNLDADIIISPATTEQLSSVMEYCYSNDIEVVTHGGRSGLSGGALSSRGQLIIQTSKLNKIIDLDLTAGIAMVESGVKLEELENAISNFGFTVGIDLAARGSATLGGMVATNAGGTQAFRNGTMRHRVLGLEVILPNGSIMSDLKKVIKANEGYDIKQLMIGAEGTLGIITKVVLNLLPRKTASSTALLSCSDAKSAAKLFQQLRAYPGCELLSAEIMWPLYAKTTSHALNLFRLKDFMDANEGVYVLIELSNEQDKDSIDFLESILAELLETELISNALIAKSASDANDFWAIREESFLCDQQYPHGFWFDVSVPLCSLDDYSENLFRHIAAISTDLSVFLFGHLGDGNLHLTVSSGQPCPGLKEEITAAVYDGLSQLGGSFSAEHGIGKDKITSLETNADANKVALMKAIKKVIDPKAIMNPGKVLDR